MSEPTSSSGPRLSVLLILIVILAFLAYHFLWRPQGETVVVYVAHDSIYAQPILERFQVETGIRVLAQYDTEATKSLGLIERLKREAGAPQADVFWNNELLGTMNLAEAGVLDPYVGTGYERIPDAFKDPAGLWTGFAARLRVYIVNTDAMTPTLEAIDTALTGDDLSRFTVADPLYGTTLTHYTILWRLLGGDATQALHASLTDRGRVEAPGNGPVRDLVAAGECDFGITDTDDYFGAKDAGKPVDMVAYRTPGNPETGGARTVCIPNTVAIIRDAGNRSAAEQLTDYLLSEAVEVELSRSQARQIPLGPVAGDQLSDEVKQLADLAADGYPLNDLLSARQQCIDWLKSEYAH